MDDFTDEIKAQAKRKLRAQNNKNHIWSGFGMFGLIGWSVAAPVVLGALLGMWIDDHYAGAHSWTLILLVVGLCIGCWNAARWVMREHKNISEEDTKDD